MSGLAAVDAGLGAAAPLPRDNGELVFEEPWQGRALGMGVVVLERIGVPSQEFREHLVAAIAARPNVRRDGGDRVLRRVARCPGSAADRAR